MSGEKKDNWFVTGNPLRFNPEYKRDFERRWTQTVNKIRLVCGLDPFPEPEEEENVKPH